MSLYRHIIASTDFTQQGDSAITQALNLAVQNNARLSILHIIDERIMQYQEILPLSPSEMEEMLLQETRRKLVNLVDTAQLEDIAYEAHVIFGKPDEQILRYAQEQQGELIVVGQGSKNFIQHVLLGSTAERLLRHSPIPILIIPRRGLSDWKSILVPVDFSDTSKMALEHAIALAQAYQAQLHVLHVSEETPFASLAGLLPLNETEGLRNSYERKVADDYDKFLASIDFQNVDYQKHFRRGTAPLEIQLWAEQHTCDLVVMGSVGRTGMRGILIGNTAERVARSIPCALLTVKQPATTAS